MEEVSFSACGGERAELKLLLLVVMVTTLDRLSFIVPLANKVEELPLPPIKHVPLTRDFTLGRWGDFTVSRLFRLPKFSSIFLLFVFSLNNREGACCFLLPRFIMVSCLLDSGMVFTRR